MVGKRKNRTDAAMPYLVLGTNASTRLVATERTTEFYFKYYVPISFGEQLTPELLALTPDPYYVKPPERGQMPEIFGENLGVWTISENVKLAIEDLEPGVHKFIPVNLASRNKNKSYGRYYLFWVGQTLDSVVIEQTQFRDGLGRAGFDKAPVLNVLTGSIVLDPKKIAGRHFWRNRFIRHLDGREIKSDDYFCSDELRRRVKAIGAEGWRFIPCELANSESAGALNDGRMPAAPDK